MLLARQFEIFAKLHGEIIICPCHRLKFVAGEGGPVQIADIGDNPLVAVKGEKFHGQSQIKAPGGPGAV
jgi:hypothetical protein